MKHFTTALISTFILTSNVVYAESDSVHHSVQASKHSALASAHGVASIATTVSAIAAVPLIIAGGTSLMIGTVSMDAGVSAIKSVRNNKPLTITETTVTADPAPNQVIIIQNKIQAKDKD